MCGICGLVGEKIDEVARRAMLEAIAHRGPDSEGIFSEEHVFLGHRRLAVLDVTQSGYQPMCYQKFVIVYNGEVYNYIEIKNELEKIGHMFKSQTDTEVILHAYAEWGDKCFEKFRGMWALAIYDKEKCQLLLSRDRFGIKPLYYFYDGRKIIFASEIKAILQAGVAPNPDMDVLMRYVIIGVDNNGEDSFFENIKQVRASTYITIDLNQVVLREHRYYDFSEEIKLQSNSTSYEQEFIEAVKLHLRSDVKVGTCLSGGLDSSTLAAVAQSLLLSNNASLMAITAKSEEKSNDESLFAEQVVNHCKLAWKIANPTYNDFVKWHQKCLYYQEEPVGSPSVFMQFWVMKEAKEAGIKVIFDGQGGDETLLGYERYYAVYLFELLKNMRLSQFVKTYYKITQSSKLGMAQLLFYFFYFLFPQIRKKVIEKRMYFIKKDIMKQTLQNSDKYIASKRELKKMQIEEIQYAQLPHLLKYEDRNSMANSIEARVPYVDHKLAEKAVGMNFRDKICHGYTKYCLRKIAEKFLPVGIAWRKRKYGFEAPENTWMEQHDQIMQEAVEKSYLIGEIVDKVPKLKLLPVRVRWRLYNLAVWEKQFLAVRGK